jgi:hypothetical protein
MGRSPNRGPGSVPIARSSGHHRRRLTAKRCHPRTEATVVAFQNLDGGIDADETTEVLAEGSSANL